MVAAAKYYRWTDRIQRMRLCSAVCLVIGSFLTIAPAKGDTEVSCVFMESCILPCSFQSGADPVIHWVLETAGKLPDQFFRGRTSLFKDQISRGNASLQLTGVEVQDQGRYRCHTSTMRGNKDSLINLRVDGMRDTQEIHKDICFSEGIYPEPDLTWSTSPPSNLNLQKQTSIHTLVSRLCFSLSATVSYCRVLSTHDATLIKHLLVLLIVLVLLMYHCLSLLFL
uniref:Ig-like domain-containing protein n=1 Tax=Lates calcarifer TaxID=8187 RepID=A0A4W6G5A6_LATCA